MTPSPSRAGTPEARLAAEVGGLSLVLLVTGAGVGAAVGGSPAAVGAALGALLVAVLGVSSAAALAWATPRGPRAALAVLGGGVVVRLVVYALALSGLAGRSWIAWPSLAVATAVGLVITIGFEARALARRPELSWIGPAEPRSTPHEDVDATGSTTT